MLHIRHPETRVPEHEYIIDVLLREFLGLDYRVTSEPRTNIAIALDGDVQAREIIIDDYFLQTDPKEWLQEASLPRLPLPSADLGVAGFMLHAGRDSLPVLYSTAAADPWLIKTDTGLSIGLDLFGGAFFMLTRYEELVIEARDRHDRFPAIASVAYRAGFLDRPIVNEYVDLLWSALRHLWPAVDRRPRNYRVLLSHDVDWPLMTLGLPWKGVIKASAGDILYRHEPSLSVRRLASRINVRLSRFDRDIGNVFDFLMGISESHNLRSTFNFIADRTAGAIDGTYSLDHPWILDLIRSIHSRHHEIGLHPSFNTYQDAQQTRREFDILKTVCMRQGIEQESWGGRQHYLRWKNPDTWRNWEFARLDYDSTLAYADRVGFRSGVCYEYPVFDILDRKRLRLRERPLIVMEASLFRTTSALYMAVPDTQGLEILQTLANRVRRHEGDLTILWHNSSLVTSRQCRLYRRCIQLVA